MTVAALDSGVITPTPATQARDFVTVTIPEFEAGTILLILPAP